MTGYAPEINLTNLHSKSPQEVFDFITAHLLKQGKRSVNENGTCVYRGPKGLMCAVGCIMSDDEYESQFEGKIFEDLATGYDETYATQIAEKYKAPSNEVFDLLNDLQEAHDEYSFDDRLPERLDYIKTKYNLI